jgi:hypothetical protein
VKKVDRNSLLEFEYMEVLNFMSSKTDSHHILGVSGEELMENSLGNGVKKGND